MPVNESPRRQVELETKKCRGTPVKGTSEDESTASSQSNTRETTEGEVSSNSVSPKSGQNRYSIPSTVAIDGQSEIEKKVRTF